jgi:hypothetical protein
MTCKNQKVYLPCILIKVTPVVLNILKGVGRKEGKKGRMKEGRKQ